MSVDELERLLRDRFDLGRADLVAALKTLPPQRPGAARLTEREAALLDDHGFTENAEAYAEAAADAIAQMGRLLSTAYSSRDVAQGLGVSDSRVRQRRLDHSLWAILDGRRWVYPAAQFDDTREGIGLTQVGGLERVLPFLLAQDVHPLSVAGFLATPQADLAIDGQLHSVRNWLLRGGLVDPVLRLVEAGDWAAS